MKLICHLVLGSSLILSFGLLSTIEVSASEFPTMAATQMI